MRQLSGVDTSFLAWEGPTTVGHVTGVLVLDPSTSPVPWTFEHVVAHLRSRLARLEPLTQKLVEVPLGLDRPYWVPDPHFDLENHVHHVGVPGDGGRRAFAELVAAIHERPLDRRRPLWECHLVDGLTADAVAGPAHGGRDTGGRRAGGGRSRGGAPSERRYQAVITQIHHAAIDGISGQEILAGLVDLTPDAAAAVAPTGHPGTETALAHPNHHPVPTGVEVLGRATLSMLTSPARMARAASSLARALPVLGPAFGRQGPAARGDESAGDLLRRFGAAPATPFNAAIGPHRRWAYVAVPLDDVKTIKNGAGCTVNDVVLAIVAGVLRRWLAERDALPDRPLVAMVPLSVRGGSEQGALGNFISPAVTSLATHIADPAERLAAISQGMTTAKRHHAALPASMLTDLTQVAPPAVAALAARLVAATRLADRFTLPFNVVVSNVPGPPIPLYLAGALILGHYPVSAIVDGVGLNITVVSTNGMLDFGFVADRALVPDLWPMADLVPPALEELAAAVRGGAGPRS